MISEINKANLEQLKQFWQETPDHLIKEYGRDLVLDEIAYSINLKDPDAFSFFKAYCYAEDLQQRLSAIYFLSAPSSNHDEFYKVLNDAFNSKCINTKIRVLINLINCRSFPISKGEIKDLDQLKNERLSPIVSLLL